MPSARRPRARRLPDCGGAAAEAAVLRTSIRDSRVTRSCMCRFLTVRLVQRHLVVPRISRCEPIAAWAEPRNCPWRTPGLSSHHSLQWCPSAMRAAGHPPPTACRCVPSPRRAATRGRCNHCSLTSRTSVTSPPRGSSTPGSSRRPTPCERSPRPSRSGCSPSGAPRPFDVPREDAHRVCRGSGHVLTAAGLP